MSKHSDPSIRDELLMLEAQTRQFVASPTKATWADRRDFLLRLATRLQELADRFPVPVAEQPAERSAA